MQGNRPADTRPERDLRRALRAAGVPGYRIGWRGAPGRPDISYPGRRLAIFVHGCFWHRCPRCALPTPRANAAFWTRKFELNRERDARKRRDLEALGWRVTEVWECQVRRDVTAVAGAIAGQMQAGGLSRDVSAA